LDLLELRVALGVTREFGDRGRDLGVRRDLVELVLDPVVAPRHPVECPCRDGSTCDVIAGLQHATEWRGRSEGSGQLQETTTRVGLIKHGNTATPPPP